MTTKTLLTAIATAAFAAGSASAAVISVPDYTFTPDGSNGLTEQVTDINALNGGNVLPTGSTSLAYFVTTFNFGTDSNVHMRAHFVASLNFLQDRLGVDINDDGLVRIFGGGPVPANAQFDLAQDLAGQSVTVLAKLDYDKNRNTNDDDTRIDVWVNPTASSLENASDLNRVWNSASFPGFSQGIENQSTPGTAGDSSITNTLIFTGGDATFANALNAAIPEPGSFALMAMGGLMIARRRRG
jgi:hypothetical protein